MPGPPQLRWRRHRARPRQRSRPRVRRPGNRQPHRHPPPFQPTSSTPWQSDDPSGVRIRDVKVILTAPDGIRLVIVKIETTEPGLYGLGCATFTQRPLVVKTAIEEYLRPFVLGRDVDDIEDIWQTAFVSSYWRTGPVLHNAMSGIDQALWDIKGKQANMPVYQLMGGKVRKAAPCYAHASGYSFEEVTESARDLMGQGFRHIRAQVAIAGMSTYGAAKPRDGAPRTAYHLRPEQGAVGTNSLLPNGPAAVRASPARAG